MQKVSMLKDIRHRQSASRARRDIERTRGRDKAGAHNWAEFLARWNAVLDISELNRKFYRDYKLVFEAVEKQVRGIEADAPAAKTKMVRDWTQRLFNRLLFLRFLEKKGWLEFDGSPDYLRALWQAPRAAGETFLKDRLYWTFFHGLNVQGEQRDIHSDARIGRKARASAVSQRRIVRGAGRTGCQRRGLVWRRRVGVEFDSGLVRALRISPWTRPRRSNRRSALTPKCSARSLRN